MNDSSMNKNIFQAKSNRNIIPDARILFFWMREI